MTPAHEPVMTLRSSSYALPTAPSQLMGVRRGAAPVAAAALQHSCAAVTSAPPDRRVCALASRLSLVELQELSQRQLPQTWHCIRGVWCTGHCCCCRHVRLEQLQLPVLFCAQRRRRRRGGPRSRGGGATRRARSCCRGARAPPRRSAPPFLRAVSDCVRRENATLGLSDARLSHLVVSVEGQRGDGGGGSGGGSGGSGDSAQSSAEHVPLVWADASGLRAVQVQEDRDRKRLIRSATAARGAQPLSPSAAADAAAAAATASAPPVQRPHEYIELHPRAGDSGGGSGGGGGRGDARPEGRLIVADGALSDSRGTYGIDALARCLQYAIGKLTVPWPVTTPPPQQQHASAALLILTAPDVCNTMRAAQQLALPLAMHVLVLDNGGGGDDARAGGGGVLALAAALQGAALHALDGCRARAASRVRAAVSNAVAGQRAGLAAAAAAAAVTAARLYAAWMRNASPSVLQHVLSAARAAAAAIDDDSNLNIEVTRGLELTTALALALALFRCACAQGACRLAARSTAVRRALAAVDAGSRGDAEAARARAVQRQHVAVHALAPLARAFACACAEAAALRDDALQALCESLGLSTAVAAAATAAAGGGGAAASGGAAGGRQHRRCCRGAGRGRCDAGRRRFIGGGGAARHDVTTPRHFMQCAVKPCFGDVTMLVTCRAESTMDATAIAAHHPALAVLLRWLCALALQEAAAAAARERAAAAEAEVAELTAKGCGTGRGGALGLLSSMSRYCRLPAAAHGGMHMITGARRVLFAIHAASRQLATSPQSSQSIARRSSHKDTRQPPHTRRPGPQPPRPLPPPTLMTDDVLPPSPAHRMHAEVRAIDAELDAITARRQTAYGVAQRAAAAQPRWPPGRAARRRRHVRARARRHRRGGARVRRRRRRLLRAAGRRRRGAAARRAAPRAGRRARGGDGARAPCVVAQQQRRQRRRRRRQRGRLDAASGRGRGHQRRSAAGGAARAPRLLHGRADAAATTAVPRRATSCASRCRSGPRRRARTRPRRPAPPMLLTLPRFPRALPFGYPSTPLWKFVDAALLTLGTPLVPLLVGPRGVALRWLFKAYQGSALLPPMPAARVAASPLADAAHHCCGHAGSAHRRRRAAAADASDGSAAAHKAVLHLCAVLRTHLLSSHVWLAGLAALEPARVGDALWQLMLAALWHSHGRPHPHDCRQQQQQQQCLPPESTGTEGTPAISAQMTAAAGADPACQAPEATTSPEELAYAVAVNELVCVPRSSSNEHEEDEEETDMRSVRLSTDSGETGAGRAQQEAAAAERWRPHLWDLTFDRRSWENGNSAALLVRSFTSLGLTDAASAHSLHDLLNCRNCYSSCLRPALQWQCHGSR
ncbi:hypothetical protein JKP88DRAFT_249564 [Tribonema minus]|uniref:Uncharacterized protein n=1 Tax=Tribonema minus TaxID=303371 RepID=A0A836C9H4_9STRA|nr:hypothetical protein JKP88DRAFT_249564 [Tribonema minus]